MQRESVALPRRASPYPRSNAIAEREGFRNDALDGDALSPKTVPFLPRNRRSPAAHPFLPVAARDAGPRSWAGLYWSFSSSMFRYLLVDQVAMRRGGGGGLGGLGGGGDEAIPDRVAPGRKDDRHRSWLRPWPRTPKGYCRRSGLPAGEEGPPPEAATCQFDPCGTRSRRPIPPHLAALVKQLETQK
jgi:hypothetical protein